MPAFNFYFQKKKKIKTKIVLSTQVVQCDQRSYGFFQSSSTFVSLISDIDNFTKITNRDDGKMNLKKKKEKNFQRLKIN
jgi:hypothetical protein